MEKWTYWDEELGSYLLKIEYLKMKEWDIINRIGQLEEKIEREGKYNIFD